MPFTITEHSYNDSTLYDADVPENNLRYSDMIDFVTTKFCFAVFLYCVSGQFCFLRPWGQDCVRIAEMWKGKSPPDATTTIQYYT
ncbi:hypothetical protein AVEN_2411-1 [Araneus ventricosus]|uniref:Uncharacterized protein n=1 Tax=Araneus ventricosus TaxID=182803 RepID=A0A4Y2Q7I9_ARAVE|nr:hypothetical protein AVEN_2411-1 [Araneus ventricosus]